MSKKLLWLLLLSLHIEAKDLDGAVFFEIYNAQGKSVQKEMVIFNEGNVLVNGEKLSSSEVITQSHHLKMIAHFKKNEDNRCEAGIFRHILKSEKKTKSETGCLGSQRYQELKKSFRALKKDRITE